MDLSVETKRKLRDMGASELLAALEAQDEGICMGMTCPERVQMAVDEAHSSFVTSKVRNLVKRAGLRYPEADVRSIDFAEERGLDRLLVTELSTCGFAERGQNVVLQGPTGTGKTYLACALAKAACQRRMRAHYVRCPDLEDLWRESRERPGCERKLTRKYAAFQVLVLDGVLHAVQAEGLARTARGRRARRRDHGSHSARHRMGRDGRAQHAPETWIRGELAGQGPGAVPTRAAPGAESRRWRCRIAISSGAQRGKYSGILREDRAEGREGAARNVIPLARVSEILKQINSGVSIRYDRGHRGGGESLKNLLVFSFNSTGKIEGKLR